MTNGKNRIRMQAGVIGIGWGDISAGKEGQQRQQISTQQADTDAYQDKAGIDI